MGTSRASKNLLLGGLKDKVKGYLNENKRLDELAAAEMDKKYPGGWAQSPTNMTELNQIRKKYKRKGRGGGGSW